MGPAEAVWSEFTLFAIAYLYGNWQDLYSKKHNGTC